MVTIRDTINSLIILREIWELIYFEYKTGAEVTKCFRKYIKFVRNENTTCE